MRLQKNTFFVRKKLQKFTLYICVVLLCVQCAQIAPLTGGVKDTEPPKALKFEPENASTNFSQSEIVIHFDEFIGVKDLANQFIITPQTKTQPDIEADGKKLKIKFSEALLPNTTYKLFFGNSIIDLHESNAIEDFMYVFSTGVLIDSLKLEGDIVNYNNKKPSTNILVGLYDASLNDSIIYSDKPTYQAKTNTNGHFKFSYLPNKPFKLMAIKDENKNLVYDGSSEELAFSSQIISLNDSVQNTLYLFKELPSKNFIKKSFSSEYGKVSIIYNKPQLDIDKLLVNAKPQDITKLDDDTLNIYYTNEYDTLRTLIHHENNLTDTVVVKIASQAQVKKQLEAKSLKYVFAANCNGSLPYFQLPTFTSNFPVTINEIKANMIYLKSSDDSLKNNIPYTIVFDKHNPTTFYIDANFKPETNYSLVFTKGTFLGSDERINDSVAYKFKTTSAEDYAQLNLKLQLPSKSNFIVQLLNDKEVIIKESLIELSLSSTSETILSYKNLLPGNYFVRVVEDANKNARFDTGNFYLKQQPETIFINANSIKLLSGWEIESEWLVK